jgi:predicted nucleic acid-binding protein
MMVALDASILAHAVNRFSPQHVRAAQVVEDLANGEIAWALPWSVVHQFLHAITPPHAVARPLAHSDAWAFIDQIVAGGSARMLGPTDHHGEALVDVMAMAPTAGGLVTGFETAVILREHGVRELLTTDRAMTRFPFLAVRNPLVGPAWSPGASPARRYRMLRPGPS